ncbi:hypothetical protein PLICRDRAFT_169783 [Plicaturopsis crispa FD-325 SS-3]|nr:hypothetical protein PLICRDRAFT_169783 [Plicaturopsis crispa FD-325 SS-3]
MASTLMNRRGKEGSLSINKSNNTSDNDHRIIEAFDPQTPLGEVSESSTLRSQSPAVTAGHQRPTIGLWDDIKTMQWVVRPASAFKLLLIPVVLYFNWELLAPYVAPGVENPFAPLLFISHHVPTSSPDDPRYQKGYKDLLFIAYYIIFFSLFRQGLTVNLGVPLARYFGISRQARIDRFGEQGHAMVYFTIMGAWGIHIMTTLPTWWYRTENFWIDYPHWDMLPQLKRYYLMHSAYWCQQLIVLVLGLEKPRKDYYELVAHHFVTLWLVGWSYLINLTLIGNAVFVSMDIPDVFLAGSLLLNLIQWKRAKVVAFAVLLVAWIYFRLWLNIRMLWSVWHEFDLIPEASKQWFPPEGVWLVWWMKYQIFFAISALLVLNFIWLYYLLRVLVRSLTTADMTDEREVEDDDEEAEDEKKDQ